MLDWRAFRARWMPGDWLGNEPEEQLRRCYEVKYELAKRFQPTRIGEIGVRAGYSALAFLLACPTARYVGYDAENGEYGALTGAVDWARRILAEYDVEIRRVDTQQINAFAERFDLLHVDGDHSFEGAYHDIVLGMSAATVVIVDDVDFIPEVRAAVTRFCENHPTVRYEYVSDGGFRGNAVLIADRKGTDT